MSKEKAERILSAELVIRPISPTPEDEKSQSDASKRKIAGTMEILDGNGNLEFYQVSTVDFSPTHNSTAVVLDNLAVLPGHPVEQNGELQPTMLGEGVYVRTTSNDVIQALIFGQEYKLPWSTQQAQANYPQWGLHTYIGWRAEDVGQIIEIDRTVNSLDVKDYKQIEKNN